MDILGDVIKLIFICLLVAFCMKIMARLISKDIIKHLFKKGK